MKYTALALTTGVLFGLPQLSFAESGLFGLQADGFKRFSVSVGALHVMPQGKGQPFNVNTAINEGYKAKVGDVEASSVLNAIDETKPQASNKKNILSGILAFEKTTLLDVGLIKEGMVSYKGDDGKQYLKGGVSGNATLNGLSNWDNAGTGLEADDVTTLGIMSNYFFTDNVSLEMKAGIPPKVDLQGKGKIYAPLSGIATPTGAGAIIGNLPLKNDIFITDLEAYGAAASARAWTPAFEFQYHFGKTGVNKFRPYVGVGLMYAYFNELKINPRTEQDLIAAGHMIANIKEGHAGAALDGKPSKADPKVKLEATDAFAPVATLGFSYDFNDKWFAVGSLSYVQLKNETTITVNDTVHGELIKSKADIEINPVLAYAGIGYRF